MSKQTRHDNYRVEIEPRGLGDFGGVIMSDRMICPDEGKRLQQYRERCEEIARDVKRHVDNVGYVQVVFDTINECQHCGHAWTEDSPDYNGGCCAADQDAHEALETQP